ncbi:MAG: RagB/SusD family nutrient uptake outer membrane protein [Bacteroidales bacterium]|nr:RagB/SusD family nutrient uptake outer membrane protein [Bacteroidales bacterium]
MKKIYTSIALASALALGSCSLDRFPMNGPSSGTFPASESEALAGTLAAYKGMGNMSAQNCYFPYNNEDCASDIFTYRPGAKNFQYQLNSSLTSDFDLVEKEYRAVFKVAGRCHQVLDKLENLRGKCSDETIAQFKAELLCIRAQQYDQAMQFYGGIPFIDHALNLEDNSYPRNTLKECAERILNEDLSDANLDVLPIAWDPAKWGTTRVGRVCAYTLKARIALNWGYLDIAKEAAAKAMNLAAGVYALEQLNIPDEAYIPHDQGEIDVTNLFGFAGENSREWMWAIQRNKMVGPDMMQTIYYSAPRVLGGCSWFGPTQGMVDSYQCKDGLSILESPLYNPENPWLNRDPRLAMTACLPGTRAMGVQYEMDCTIAEVANYNALDASGNPTTVPNADANPKVNKYEYAANNTKGPGGFYCRKFYDPVYVADGSITDREDQLNTGLIRYAELLLIDAEANIESPDGDLARAKRDLDELRARVKMPALKVSDRDGLRSALRYERKVELAGEGFRWFDLRRWANDGGLCYENGELNGKASVASVAMNGPQWCMGFSKSTAPKAYISNAKPIIDKNWTVLYDENSVWKSGDTFNLRKFDTDMKYDDAKDRLWPFPAKEINTNPAMDPDKDQNPGYGTAK